MPPDPFGALGDYLTAQEAIGLAVLLADGQPDTVVLREINPSRREVVKDLLAGAGLGHGDVDRSVAVLHAIAGAKTVRGDSRERDVRHEAPINRVEMKGLHRWPVAAGQ
jgi:hypothetical protein